MSDHVLRTRGLRKVYRSSRRPAQVAVAGLDLDVEAGGVHGFLGPNGSGKTTTIRMLLGLARPTAGSMELLGRPVPDGLPETMARVGAVVESPKFFPGFTGRRNLRLLAEATGLPPARVDAVLAQVGLTERAEDRFRGYSLGMRQRLAIAATLLKEPRLLVLDEPTNGLDPQGIRDIRAMIRDLADDGVTVLISSHILAEIEQVCDAVTILRRGELVASGTVSELVGRDRVGDLLVEVDRPGDAAQVLVGAGLAARLDGSVVVVGGVEDGADVTRLLAGSGHFPRALHRETVSLETAFLELTGGEGAIDPGLDGGSEGVGRR